MSGIPAMVKEFVFKDANSGTAKSTGKPFNVIELHDPETLENSKFFIQRGIVIHTAGLQIHDRVIANFEMGMFNGRPSLDLVALEKL